MKNSVKGQSRREKAWPRCVRGMLLCLVVLCQIAFFVSCHEDSSPATHVARQTVMVFMPWSTNLETFFEEIIKDFEKAIAEGVLTDERVVVCIATDTTTSMYLELRQEKGKAVRDTLQTISHPDYTNPATLTSMFLDLSHYAPAHRYSLIIGGHGMAWLPATASLGKLPVRRMNYAKRPVTRWFGGIEPKYRIEIRTLADAIAAAQLHFDYILFDDCFMSSVEVAYELREVTDHLVACPTEIMAYGFPYHQCARYLVGNVDYQRLCDSFLEFYKSYYQPYGTIAVTDCRELQALANVVRTINVNFRHTYEPVVTIQTMDGYSPHLFYDFGDTFDHICPDGSLLTRFHEQLERTVPYKANTEYYYTSVGWRKIKVNHYSGITTSEISENVDANSYDQTAWYRATH